MGLDSAGWQGPGWPGDLPPRDAACSSRRRPAFMDESSYSYSTYPT